MSVKTIVKSDLSEKKFYSFEADFRNPDQSYNFQEVLEKVGGRRVLKCDKEKGVFYNIQTFSNNATEGLKKGNNRRGTWVCPPTQISKFMGKLEKLSAKGQVPDRTIAWKQPHQIERENKSSPIWFDFDVKDTNIIPEQSVEYKIDGEQIGYVSLCRKLASVISGLIEDKFPKIQNLFYYIYYDEVKIESGFWIYFNKNLYIQDKRDIFSKFHIWCEEHLIITGLIKPKSFWKDTAPLKNPFVAPLVPKENRAFKIILESNDPEFIGPITYKSKKDLQKVFKYNRLMEQKLFHHQNNLEIVGVEYPPEMSSGDHKDIGTISSIANAEFLHRLNRLRTQYPELSDVLTGAEHIVSEGIYRCGVGDKGVPVWNIKIEANKCVCPIHKTTHHRAVGYVNIYKGSLNNTANFYCSHSGTSKVYLDKELTNKLGKPKQSKSLLKSQKKRHKKWVSLFTLFKFSSCVVDVSRLGLMIKAFYPDIKYVAQNTGGTDCFYRWDNKTGIWEEMKDKGNARINNLIRTWWSKYAVNDLISLSTELHIKDDDTDNKKFLLFKKKIAKLLQTKSKINDILDSFKIESGMNTQSRFGLKLNSKRHLLPFKNGTIDWGMRDKKGLYIPPKKPFRCIEKEDYISMYIDKIYAGKYNRPNKFPFTIGEDTFESREEYDKEYKYLWNKLDGLFNKTLRRGYEREYVKNCIGYGQTGYTHFKIFLALLGDLANNGKSTMLQVLKAQLYPFCNTLSCELFTESKIDACKLEPLRTGIRIGFVEEIAKNKTINAQRVKEYVGLLNEIAKIRVLYCQQEAEFNFMCKFMFATNFNVPFNKNDNGLVDRLRASTFDTRFCKANEWERRLKRKSTQDNPEKYWNDRGYFPEDSMFAEIFKQSELMASVFQDYFYPRSVQAIKLKDLPEPEEMIKFRQGLCEKTDQLAQFIEDSIAQGILDEENLKKSSWISRDQFFKYWRRWLAKTQSGIKDWKAQVQVQKFNFYIKKYINTNERYEDILHKINGSKTITNKNGAKTISKNIVYGLKWIHKEIYTDEETGIKYGGWDKIQSYAEEQRAKKQKRYEAQKNGVDYESEDSSDGDDESDAVPEPVKLEMCSISKRLIKKKKITILGRCRTCKREIRSNTNIQLSRGQYFCGKHKEEFYKYRDNYTIETDIHTDSESSDDDSDDEPSAYTICK